jgi:beta-glucosidase
MTGSAIRFVDPRHDAGGETGQLTMIEAGVAPEVLALRVGGSILNLSGRRAERVAAGALKRLHIPRYSARRAGWVMFPVPLGGGVRSACGGGIARGGGRGGGRHPLTFAPCSTFRATRAGAASRNPGRSVAWQPFAETSARFQGVRSRRTPSPPRQHFAAYGAVTTGRNGAVDISERALREVYLPPFAARHPRGTAHHASVHRSAGVPMTAHEAARDSARPLGFDGVSSACDLTD